MQAHKRTYDQLRVTDYQIKRRVHQNLEQLGSTQHRVLNIPPQVVLNSQGCATPSGATTLYVNQQMRLVPSQSGTPQQLLIVQHQQQQHRGSSSIAACTATRGVKTTVVSTTHESVPVTSPGTLTISNGTMHVTPQPQHLQHPAPQQYIQQIQTQHVTHPYLIVGALPGTSYLPSYVEERATPQSDPFTPPSYAPEMKNAIVLQPLWIGVIYWSRIEYECAADLKWLTWSFQILSRHQSCFSLEGIRIFLPSFPVSHFWI